MYRVKYWNVKVWKGLIFWCLFSNFVLEYLKNCHQKQIKYVSKYANRQKNVSMMQQIFLKRRSREQTTPDVLCQFGELSTMVKEDLSYVAKNSLKKVKSERWRVNHCHKIEWSSQKIGVTSSQFYTKDPSGVKIDQEEEGEKKKQEVDTLYNTHTVS